MAGHPRPRYGEASLADIVPSAIGALGLGGANLLGIAPSNAVVIMVVDGLGARQLDRHGDVAPFLHSQATTAVDATFPSTTATALTSIGTGLAPGQHGLTGYAVAHPDHDHPLNLLTWRVGLRGGGFDARAVVVPEDYQPAVGGFERAQQLGARVAVVLHPDFTTSGLTRAGLRGGTRVEAVGLEATLEAALAATHGRGPHLVYAHHPDIDTAGHVHGPGSDAWCEALAALDAALARLVERLPHGTTLLVTADHGMVAVPAADVCELSEVTALADGVRVLAGEPRVRQVWCHDGARETVLAAWRETLDGRAIVLTREAAIAAGLFGVVADHVVDRIGELVVIATHGSLAHRQVDPLEGRLVGQHGALSREELDVPLITLRG